RTVASGSGDTTALLWNVQGLSARTGPGLDPLSPEAAEARWADLASDNPSAAGEAVNQLAASPQQAVPLLAKHLRPAEGVDPALIEKLIEQLDSGEFKARQQSQSQLLQIGDRAMPYVEK